MPEQYTPQHPPGIDHATISIDGRLMRACGIVVCCCLIGAGMASPDPPSHGANADQVLAFYAQHSPGISIGAFLWDVGMAALLLFSTALSRTSAGWPSAALCLAAVMPSLSAVASALFITSQAIGASAGVVATRGATATSVRALDEAAHLVSHLATMPLGAWLLAAAVSQRRFRSGAPWIAWLGIVSGVTLIVTTSWIAIGQPWIHNAGVIGLLGFLIWSLSSSVSLLVQKDASKCS